MTFSDIVRFIGFNSYIHKFESGVTDKKVTVDFSAPELSSLSGLSLVREYEKSSNRIIERIESCIKDPRWEPMVIHSRTEMLRQRIYRIMAGFEDADDCDMLCRDGLQGAEVRFHIL